MNQTRTRVVINLDSIKIVDWGLGICPAAPLGSYLQWIEENILRTLEYKHSLQIKDCELITISIITKGGKDETKH